jgi:hypothetical protein
MAFTCSHARLKQRSGDEDKWDGFDIPRGIVLRLIDWFKE